MKILLVCKRHPQQRDLIERPYGRFYHLPAALAARGHEVRVLLCSHHGLPALEREHASATWSSNDIRTLGWRGYLRYARQEAAAFGPDWVVGLSDAWYGWLACILSRQTGARLAVDAYDNYEAYMPWNFPLHWQWRHAVRVADCVTAAGPQLASLLDRQRHGRTASVVVPMAADPAFVRSDRYASRAELGLPVGAPLIGYSGSWARNRGTHTLLEAFRLVRATNPDARLVLTGRPPPSALAEQGVVPLGYLPDSQLPLALSALDVACVITADTSFGRYSYPAKLCEAMACGIPVVATATNPVRWMLQDDARFIAPIGNTRSLADRIVANLAVGTVTYPCLPNWDSNAQCFEDALLAAQGSPAVGTSAG